MRELKPNWVSKLVKFSPAAVDCLARNGQTDDAYIQGGVSKDGTIGWLVRGAALEVFSNSDGQRLAAWCYGVALKDQQTVITAVTEYTYDNGIKLLVATITPNTESALLSVFDVKTSRVLKSVEIPYQVTALEGINNIGSEQLLDSILSEHLRCFCGVVAVGTLHGHVYLLDMCIDDDVEESDEVLPNGILFLDPRTGDVATKRYNAMTKRKHLCLELDEESHGRGYCYFRKPDGSVIKTYAEGEVEVTTLSFLKQAGTLAVGYSFGCFQLWRLNIPVLEYSSRYEDNLEAVVHFAYQEPENDPRNFAYLWVTRGPLPHNSIEEGTSTISLFQLGFSNKVTHDQLGHLFEELTSVCLRFDHVLTDNPLSSGDDSFVGSRVISCFTILDTRLAHLVSHDEDSFESLSGPDLSLCTFVWEAAPSDPHSKSIYHIGIFDMNRWYHAQMPFSIRSFGHSYESCNYFAFYSVEDVADAIGSDNLMAVHIGYDSVSKYNSCILPAPEQHFWPSSLAFDAVCIAETGLVSCRCLGAQRQILSDLQCQGPSVLLDPRDMYSMCLSSGLLPRNMDISVSNVHNTQKRDAIMTVALDHNMVNWLAACVHQFTSQEFISAGCNLRTMLDWAWTRVGHIKENLDRLCVTLYDWSGVCLDRHALNVLQQYCTSLQHLVAIFQLLASQSMTSTMQGQRDLEAKVGVVTLISQHLQVVLWFHGVGMLPEHSEDEEITESDYCYPSKLLRDKYTLRRQDIQRINRDLRSTDLLLIDGLLEGMGSTVQHLMEKEGGNGLYPPPSFHTVVNLYLLEGIPLIAKHTAVLYLLFDLMHLEENTDLMPERVGSFLSTFNIPQSLAKLVQGLWSVDHKRFDDAMLLLLDPSIKAELVSWQHTRIIKSTLYQNAAKLALKYMRVKRLPLQTPEDVKLRLTVLLANGLTAEAYEYQRICRDQLSGDDLLSHLFLACHQMKTVDRLLQLPMHEEEEHRLVDYLKTTQESNSSELLLLHYLQRSRFIEAVRLNNRLKNMGLGETDAASRERATARNAIVDCYHHVLPKVQRKLAFGPEQLPRKPTQTRKEVIRPVPLSSVVNRVQRSQAITQAMLINSVMEKVREVTEESTDTPREEAQGNDSQPGTPASDAPGPFICTPITPRTKKRTSEATELVFASVKPQATEQTMNLVASPLRRSHASPLSGIPYGDSLRLSDAAKRRMSRYYSAEALSLLQTPPVRRKTPSKTPAPSTSLSSTPQSILKIRTQSRRSPSPREFLKNKLAAELKMPTPPRFTRKVLADVTPVDSTASSVVAEPPSIAPSTTGSTSSSLPGTPKQLRFSVPVSPELINAESPDYIDMEEESEDPIPTDEHLLELQRPTVRPPLKSTRERSPTPERMSPKLSPNTEFLSRKNVEPAAEAVNADNEDGPETSNLDAHQSIEVDNSEDELTDEAITFNFNKSKEMLVNNDDEQEDMDTDADTEPWVGTVKSIQAQEEEEDEEEEADLASDTVEEVEDIDTEIASSQEEESNREEEPAHDESPSDPQKEDIENSDIVLKLDESEGESPQTEKEEMSNICHADLTSDKISVISNTVVIESTVESVAVEHDEVRHTVEEDEKSEAQDEPDSTTGRVTPEDHQFKTPPRPSRLSEMPPTPPESGQGTPPQQPSPVVSRSREASPVSTTQDIPLTRSTHKSRISEDQNLTDTLSTRVTRSSSRSVSPATGTESEPGKASVKRTPSRKGRSKRSPKAPSGLGDDEMAPSTPTRRSTRSTSREPESSEIVDTPSRRTRSAKKSDVLSRTPDAELVDQSPLTPSRRTRASVAKAAKAEGLIVTDSSENVTTPRRSIRTRSFRETPDTPSRRGRSAKDDLLDNSKSEIGESMTPSKTKSSRITAKVEESDQKTVGTPVRRGRSFRGKTVSESHDVNERPQPVTPRTGRSAKGDATLGDMPEVVTPTRSGRKAKLTVTETPEKIKGRSHKDKSKEMPTVQEGSVTPTNTERDMSIVATPVKASKAFKKSSLNDSMLIMATTEDRPTRNTPRRTPSRRVKAVAEDTESQETVPSKPVRRTPSRRVKAAMVDDDPVMDTSSSQDVITETGKSRSVRRTPSRRAKSGLVDTEPEKSVDVKAVDEPAKSPGRRGRSKPQLIVTPIDDRAGGDAEMMTIKEVDDIKTLGPLSANSFMMTMRTKGDTTPDSLVPPDVPSESSSVSAEDVQFNFSEPMAVETEKGSGIGGTGDDLKSFIFSPPLTRTRRRQSTDLLSEPQYSILPQPMKTVEPVQAKKAKTAKKSNKNEDKVKTLDYPSGEDIGEGHKDSTTKPVKSKKYNLFRTVKARSLLALPKSKKSKS